MITESTAAAEFSLHERLAAGSADLGRLGLCRVLLKDNAHFLWLVLVPEVPADITELHHLSVSQFESVMATVRGASAFVEANFAVDKINVGCIGNQVSQLHIHVVGRRKDDVAWPGVVWSCKDKLPHAPGEWTRRQELIREFVANGENACG